MCRTAAQEYGGTIGHEFFTRPKIFSKLDYIYCKDYAEHGSNNNQLNHINHAQNVQE